MARGRYRIGASDEPPRSANNRTPNAPLAAEPPAQPRRLVRALIDQHMPSTFAGRIFSCAPSPGAGRIVIFTSGPPQNGAIAYAASKGALEWITYSAATELGPRGITVNAVNPGPNQPGWMTHEIEQEAVERTPVGRAGRPQDAAAVVSFLLSDDAAFINGQVITADGRAR